MKGAKVLDSWALLAYFEGEPAGEKVRELLKEASEKGRNFLMSVINWGEVLYTIESRHNKETCTEVEHVMNKMHLEVIDADKELTRLTAHLKATEKLSYGDAFAAALASLRKADLVTGDRDFRTVERFMKINWL